MHINKEYLKNQQYRDASNLAARRALFQYGTNAESLWHWVCKQYSIQAGSKILEVGCGSGEFWREAIKVFPDNCAITLTDLSSGMLESVQKNLPQLANCQFEVADVEHLAYGNCSFDVVFAHLMLYHTASPECALAEIKRVLKKSGFAGILLSGEDNMQPLFTLLSCENPRQAQRFSAEMAINVLPEYFSDIKQHVYQNTLRITEVEPLIAYVRSLSKMDEKGDSFYAHCRAILTKQIKDKSYIELPTSRHLFIAR